MSTIKDLPVNKGNATGTMEATLTELLSGKQYALQPYDFSRRPGANMIVFVGMDPEINAPGYFFALYFYFNNDEPASKEYIVGDADWRGSVYVKENFELESPAEAGSLTIENYPDEQVIKGKINILYKEVFNAKFKIEGAFKIQRPLNQQH